MTSPRVIKYDSKFVPASPHCSGGTKTFIRHCYYVNLKTIYNIPRAARNLYAPRLKVNEFFRSFFNYANNVEVNCSVACSFSFFLSVRPAAAASLFIKTYTKTSSWKQAISRENYATITAASASGAILNWKPGNRGKLLSSFAETLTFPAALPQVRWC